MPMPFYVNPPWADIVTTTRDNRSVEHGSLFTKTDPSEHHHESPVHPIIPKSMVRKNGSYAVRKTKAKK